MSTSILCIDNRIAGGHKLPRSDRVGVGWIMPRYVMGDRSRRETGQPNSTRVRTDVRYGWRNYVYYESRKRFQARAPCRLRSRALTDYYKIHASGGLIVDVRQSWRIGAVVCWIHVCEVFQTTVGRSGCKMGVRGGISRRLPRPMECRRA